MSSAKNEHPSFSNLINGDTPVLVDFYADWCAPCKMMPPILKKLKSMMGDSITIIKINTERNTDVALRYQVRSIPTLILFHKGQVLWQQAGVVQAEPLKEIIETNLNQ
ncbi:MAG: thioredoxin [Balneolaceae bacterium]|nr:thioredoxin [Balneolaceae bacterium]